MWYKSVVTSDGWPAYNSYTSIHVAVTPKRFSYRFFFTIARSNFFTGFIFCTFPSISTNFCVAYLVRNTFLEFCSYQIWLVIAGSRSNIRNGYYGWCNNPKYILLNIISSHIMTPAYQWIALSTIYFTALLIKSIKIEFHFVNHKQEVLTAIASPNCPFKNVQSR